MANLSCMSSFQEEVADWAYFNFGEAKGPEASLRPLAGITEENGELAHSILKMVQGVRTSENHSAKAADAVGDLVIYLADLCNRMGLSLPHCIETAWNEVRQRNWRYNPVTGYVDKSGEPVPGSVPVHPEVAPF